ncbi:MAG: peptidylprolyl isomerase [Rhodocyclaceae bacterium]|nr:peptidylprolyl isomerase [Rhodocyclaceae bacterium]
MPHSARLFRPLLNIATAALLCGLVSPAEAAKAPSEPAARNTKDSYSSQGTVDGVAAIVNQDVITTREFDERMAQTRARLAKQNVRPPEAELARQVLERLILDKIIAQRAAEDGIRVSDKTLEMALTQIADNNRTDMDGLQKRVAEEGISWPTFREQIRGEILQARVRERDIDPTIQISDAELDSFLSTQKAAFSGREYQVAHILLSAPESASEEDWERLQARAAEIERKLEAGEHFAQLAARYSQAPDAAQGGLLDWRPAERLPSVFTEAILKLSPGQRAPVLRSDSGLHIVMLVNVRGGELSQGEETLQTHARHILIKTSEVLTDEDAQSRLHALRERIAHGESFAEIARVHSADLNGAKGGDLGWLTPGDTVPAFERAMDALAPGELSEPVKSQFGWHLIEVLERRKASLSDEQKRKLAYQVIARRKAEEAFDEWLREARDSAYVDIRLPQLDEARAH